jgi:NADPH:quinone reductase-like Zn-dependent oxidoreductase
LDGITAFSFKPQSYLPDLVSALRQIIYTDKTIITMSQFTLPQTQKSIAIAAKRAPLVELTASVEPPAAGEVVVRVEWTASTPLDLHRADGGLLLDSYPVRTGGGGAAGRVVAAGPDVEGLRVGDRVMAFAFHGGKESNHQEYITIPTYLASKIPEGLSMEEAVTIPVNLVTVFHTVTHDLGIELPWPVPDTTEYKTNPVLDQPILLWGASSSVGIYAVQVLKHWGFKSILAVSSAKHHEYLKSLGASAVFDYTKPGVIPEILSYAESHPASGSKSPKIPYIIDCIGSVEGTLKPLSKIAEPGSRVAIMLPVIIKDATEDEEPEYEMDVSKVLQDSWAEGVTLRGVRTHFYLNVSSALSSSLGRIHG